MATLQRAEFLQATLMLLLPQLTERMEVVIVDGGSTDSTEAVVREFAKHFAATHYYFHDDQGGLDRDYDRAVSYARGEFCWLLTDDDAILPGGLQVIFEALESGPELLVLNGEVRDEKLDRILQKTRFPESRSASYPRKLDAAALAELGGVLSFIGAVVIRRSVWVQREATRFYGSMFIHVGVILQKPALSQVDIVEQPVLALRYGNASWSSRYFEIWTFLWPDMIWQFTHYDGSARSAVTQRQPWKSPLYLLKQRARGAYSLTHYRRWLSGQPVSLARIIALSVALCPAILVNLLAILFLALLAPSRKLGMYDLLRSPHSTALSRWLGRIAFK